jgi:hypothetical protein
MPAAVAVVLTLVVPPVEAYLVLSALRGVVTRAPARRRRPGGLEAVAAVIGVLIYLSWIIDAVLYRNWIQLAAYVAQAVGVLLLIAFLHRRNRRAARGREHPSTQ